MNARILSLIIASALLSSGCSTTARLYPVDGALSEDIKYQVLEAHVSGIEGNNGKITLDMPDGESCKGEWSSAAGAGLTISSTNFITKYGSIYGSAVSKSTGTGQNPGQAILICNTGRRIEFHFLTGAGTANGFGFGEDNYGNVYKVLF